LFLDLVQDNKLIRHFAR